MMTLSTCINEKNQFKVDHPDWCCPDMGAKLLRLQLHEAEAFEAKALASASAS